jgi:hypothetical protein
MKNPLGEVPVIGQKQGSLGLKVESANMQQGLDIGEKLPERRSAFRIVQGGDDPPRFVEEEKKGFGLPSKRLSFNQNGVGLRVDPGSRFGHDLSVYTYESRCDQLFGLSSGCHSPVGEKFVKTNRIGFRRVLFRGRRG